MNVRIGFISMIMVGALVLPTFAQDSVSNTGLGMPGDAVDTYDTNEQVNAYVLDLTPFESSWGTRFGIAPLAKAGKATSQFFNNALSAQYLSKTLRKSVPFPADTYYVWNGPGYGVNDVFNDMGSAVDVSDLISNQFAATFSEWTTTDEGASGNYITTAVVNYRPEQPGRLYVYRVNSAVNAPSGDLNLIQFGTGSVDADGNTYFRADDFGVDPGGPTGNNIFRIDALARNPAVLNAIIATGPTDTGDWLINQSTDTYGTPCCVPADLAGRPVYYGANFNAQLAYESGPLTVLFTQAHLGASPDHRGGMAFSPVIAFPNAFPATVGTGSCYGRNLNDETRWILLWGVTNNGNVSGNQGLVTPLNLVDNDDGRVWPAGTEKTSEFIHYVSQTAFRGGNGPVAVGQDQLGNIIVATVTARTGYSGIPGENPYDAVVVARFDPTDPSTTLEWTMAGYVDDFSGTLDGKDILDGPDGNVIGRQAALFEVTGGTPIGPSISPPMIDSVGNIWFLSAVEFFGPVSDYDVALIRAVYNPGKFSYQLESVVELGDIFHGMNSQRDYLVTFMGIADSNSVDSGTVFSGNILPLGWNGRVPPAGVEPVNPQTLGGLVFRATVVYDVNDNGTFDTDTEPDEQYSMLMYLGWPGNKVTVRDGVSGSGTNEDGQGPVPPTSGGKAN